MGAETTCAVTFKGKTSTAKVRLETNDLQIRGSDLKLDLRFSAMKTVAARDGSLLIGHAGGALTLRLGAAATRWADKILHPPSRLTKIGARPEWRTIVIGDVENDFVEELRAAVNTVSIGRMVKEVDAIFVGVSNPSDFKRLSALKARLKPSGAVWLIRPKGNPHVTEGAVMAAGKSVGLVDVKVVAFSTTHSAMKFVIPVKDRPRS
jgi:hypothetical protein